MIKEKQQFLISPEEQNLKNELDQINKKIKEIHEDMDKRLQQEGLTNQYQILEKGLEKLGDLSTQRQLVHSQLTKLGSKFNTSYFGVNKY